MGTARVSTLLPHTGLVSINPHAIMAPASSPRLPAIASPLEHHVPATCHSPTAKPATTPKIGNGNRIAHSPNVVRHNARLGAPIFERRTCAQVFLGILEGEARGARTAAVFKEHHSNRRLIIGLHILLHPAIFRMTMLRPHDSIQRH